MPTPSQPSCWLSPLTTLACKLIRTVGLVRARLKIWVKNLAYNFQRFLVRSAPQKRQVALGERKEARRRPKAALKTPGTGRISWTGNTLRLPGLRHTGTDNPGEQRLPFGSVQTDSVVETHPSAR
jgi:hypothetical protein